MTGHYEKFLFSAKFSQDLGVIKTKIVSFSKTLFLLSLLVSIARPGFSLVQWTWPRMTSLVIRWKTLPIFFQREKRHIINNLLTSSVPSLQGNHQTSALMYWPSDIDKASIWDFPVMTSLSVNKWYLLPVIWLQNYLNAIKVMIGQIIRRSVH